MEALITTMFVAVTPAIVSFLTQKIKKLKAIELSKNRIAIIRVVAVVLSFTGTVLFSIVDGTEIDQSQITTFVENFGVIVVYGLNELYYYIAKKRNMVQ